MCTNKFLCQTPGWKAKTLEMEGPREPPPASRDRRGAALLAMYVFGVGSVFPWNALITPVEYFQFRLRDTPFLEPFESILSVTVTSTAFLTVWALQWLQHKISMRQRIIGSLVTLVGIFIVLAGSAVQVYRLPDQEFEQQIKSDGNLQFAIIIACSALAGICQSFFSLSCFSYSAILGPRYIGGVSGGQGIAGLAVTIISLLLALPRVSKICASQLSGQAVHYLDATSVEADRELAYSAVLYFITAVLIMLLNLIAFLMVERLPFTKASMQALHEATLNSNTSMSKIEPGTVSGTENSTPSNGLALVAQSDEMPLLKDKSKKETSDHSKQWEYLWKWGVAVTIVYIVTIAIFPALTVTITSVGGVCGGNCQWGHLLGASLFILFNFGDTVGRNFPFTLKNPNSLIGWSVARVLFALLFMACHTGGHPRFSFLAFSDVTAIVVMFLFAFSNGWLTTSMYISSQQAVPLTMVKDAASFLTLYLNGGIFVGAAMSFLLRFLNCTPGVENGFSCNPFINAGNFTAGSQCSVLG